MKLFTVTYTINGKTVTSKGHTAEGVNQIMNIVIRMGGTVSSCEQQKRLQRAKTSLD